MHGHPEPVAGFFTTHGLDPLSNRPDIIPGAHGCECSKQQTETKGLILGEGPSFEGFTVRREAYACLPQQFKNTVLNEIKVTAS